MFVALLGLAAAHATGCVQLNASHCANLQGTATCVERGAGVCSKCTSENDGCVQTVDAECEVGVDATEGGTTTESVTGSTTVGMSMSSTSATSSTTVEPGTDESTTMEPPKMDMGSFCGDGRLDIDAGETCDGNAFIVEDCEGLDYASGELGCTADCELDVSDCVGEVPCGNGEIDDGEECDGLNFNGATCASVGSQHGMGGELHCETGTCTIDDTLCCRAGGEGCLVHADCCSNACGDGLMLLTCMPVDPE